jgi:hypothetical protein
VVGTVGPLTERSCRTGGYPIDDAAAIGALNG